MRFQYVFILMIVMVLFISGQMRGQSIVNPGSVNVNALSDSQIDQIIQQIQARGLSEEQASALAKSQGASQAQIDQLLVRIQQRQMPQAVQPSNANIPTVNVPTPEAGSSNLQGASPKASLKATEKSKQVFGYHLFNSENLTFEPSLNIPTPKNYVLGIGDQVVITVWGASQRNYQLVVDQNGAVTIPDIGPVFLSGISFENAQTLLKNRLIAIYNGMSGQYPNTWAEVSLGGLRSIKVNVIGDINAPGTYTLPSTASAFNALYLSGGPNENGSFREIRVIRDGVTIHKIDVYDFLINADPSSNIQLRDQDIIFVPTSATLVGIGGQIKRPGLFEMKSGETLKDLIRFAGGFTEKAYTYQLSLIRNNEREREMRDIPNTDFDGFVLRNGDMVEAGAILERFSNRVAVSGAVLHPGDFELTEGMRLSDLLKKADGLREDAFMNRGLISRLKDDYTPENISFDLKEVMSGKNDILLKKEDQVTIRSNSEMKEEPKVRILGEVLNPQSFEYRDNMTLGDLIFKAGGFREGADLAFIEMSRRLSYEKAAKVGDRTNEILQFGLTRDLKLSSEDASFRLQPFDEVYVRRAPGFRDQGTVSLSGEVTYAGIYSITNKNERISDVIRRAGGLLPGAYLKGATLTRKNQLSTYSVGIELDKILAKPGTDIDLLLLHGDLINIPKQLQTVKVSGGVLNPIALTYEDHYSLKRYIDRAGGYTPKAKKSKIYVVYPNGTNASTRGIIFRWVPKVSPGSEIIVPEKPEKKANDNDAVKWISIAGLMSSLAVSMVALVNLTK